MTTGVDTWRLGEAATQPAIRETAQARRKGESLIRGEVVLMYFGVEDELVGSISRTAVFPVLSESVRAQNDGKDLVLSFPVRGSVDSQPFEQRITWFRVDPHEWARASLKQRLRAIESAGPVPRVVLTRQLAPLPPKGARTAQQPGRRRIDYGDGQFAIITDGEAREIEFSDGETVTVTDLPESGDEPVRTGREYVIPRTSLEVLDGNGLRVGLTTGMRYRACDAMREDDR
jgi:hypothetical protein